ncbi:hypothetical protein HYPSUDRAFT_200362 [Hypholoma sublateritium FD-334 SS-4]|uniref:Uncharacterized protein n=1 Tax=Hypholoma sublateritium (strain FD-334 SS-4) TaxID=945553 RepID=A0A0D2P853_HYPSF|nr:hypothetical protein HYPSUDRAFT_200362 [Hypholoma sublateritium FD-334 SS-4]
MSLDLDTPPVYNLPDDLLWNIFSLNANMFTNEDALSTTRFTSQVCRIWRNNMLNTPSLWGRLIDFDSLHGLKSIKWAQELIRRSDHSLLWIKSNKRWCRPIRSSTHIPPIRSEHNFFFGIVTENWDRIQRLVLSAPIVFGSTTLDDLTILRRPAPNLEVFSVEAWIVDGNQAMKNEAFQRLFSGDAPMLRQFSDMSCRIDLNTPWFQNLDSIQLGWVFDIYECLTIVSSIPNLQHLTVQYSTRPPIYSPRPIVSLPQLKRLSFDLNLEEATYMLDHLRIPQGCSLDLQTSPPSFGRDSYDELSNLFDQATSAISRASRQYFQSHPPRALDITYSGSMMSFSDDTNRDSAFELGCDSLHESSIKVVKIFSALACPEFARVTELKLLYNVNLPSAPFSAFLRCFVSVETLHTDERTFSRINATRNLLTTTNGRPQIIFPNLIKICILNGTQSLRAVGEKTVKFILSRIEDGHPISVLDLTECREPDTPTAEILLLKEISGLEVIFKADTVTNA